MGKVRSTFSDQQGRVVVDFAFDNLMISHINYQKESVKVLSDTLFMEQSMQLLSEVVVESCGGSHHGLNPCCWILLRRKQRSIEVMEF